MSRLWIILRGDRGKTATANAIVRELTAIGRSSVHICDQPAYMSEDAFVELIEELANEETVIFDCLPFADLVKSLAERANIHYIELLCGN